MVNCGFPRMHKEKNEKRDFLPNFFKYLKNEKAEFYLENGYGSDLGFTKDDYLKSNPNIIFVDNKECYKKDAVIVLRSPEFEQIKSMKDGSMLISMLHYPTRETRRELLKRKNICGVSLDSVRNDLMERIVVNYTGTSGNAIRAAFEELSKSMDNFFSRDRKVINVSIIGMGMVGLMAAKAARVYGSPQMYKRMKEIDAKGVIVRMLSRSITKDRSEMVKILKKTDILVDASTREVTSDYIIKNDMLENLKPYSIILDLTADPYLTDVSPIQVKAIEGIPTGTLDKTVFYPEDKIYDSIPKEVSTKNRRIVVSCNAWPGIDALKCMEMYGKQMVPIMKKVLRSDVRNANELSDGFFSRAIYRGSIEYYEKFEKAGLLV